MFTCSSDVRYGTDHGRTTYSEWGDSPLEVGGLARGRAGGMRHDKNKIQSIPVCGRPPAAILQAGPAEVGDQGEVT